MGASVDNYITDFSAVLSTKFGRWDKKIEVYSFL